MKQPAAVVLTQIPFVHWPHTPSRFTSWSAEGGAALLAYNGDWGLLETIAVPHSAYMVGVNGSAPAGWAWEFAAFASSEPGQLVYRGANSSAFANCGPQCCHPGNPCPGDGVNTTEPDKVAGVGLGYARLYQLTGSEAQLAAAVRTADTLLATEVLDANATHSPWPFRVRADTGRVVEPYSSQMVDALRLFDALAAIARAEGTARVPRVAEYLASRERVLAWLAAVPMASDAWQGMWEDVPVWASTTDDPNCHSALDAAAYLLDLADAAGEAPGAATLAAVRRIVDWVVDTFVYGYATAREPAVQWGALAVSEQGCDRNKMAFHTLHWVSVAARLANATANATLLAQAARSFNWCTYVLQLDNQTLIGPVDQSNWIATGLRLPAYAISAISATPQWAAPGRNHIVRATSLVLGASLAAGAPTVSYRTYGRQTTEWLHLGACVPVGVTADGQPLGLQPAPAPAGWWSLSGTGAEGVAAITVFKLNATTVTVHCQPPP